MNLRLCDFCRKPVPDDAEAHVVIHVSRSASPPGAFPLPAYMTGAQGQQVQLDCCVPCATAKEILARVEQPVANRGVLTEEEIRMLEGTP